MSKKLVALAATGMILLAGCSDPSGSGTNNARSISVTLPNGGSVICVVYDDSNYGTELDCLESTIKKPQPN